ncbi:MAG: transglutaminase-like cysteine peptidase [Desulfovibrio sp.]|jgi:predicted transglutaminase-like cysteine proteinase|nr:transglutaminase-like cysteine peptidase [Desulfovibrio sp.]
MVVKAALLSRGARALTRLTALLTLVFLCAVLAATPCFPSPSETSVPEAPDSAVPDDQKDGAEASGQETAAEADGRERTDGGAGEQAPPIRLFKTVEFRSPIKNLPKWERVLGSETANTSFTVGGLDTERKDVAARWARLKGELADAPLKKQVSGVNNFFNQWPYKTDIEIWGVEDYWATPREFVKLSGDCEDYVIAKYYALRDLGIPAKTLRIAAVKDNIRNLGHSVLVVFMENDAYVLDNLTNLVLSHKKLTHYVPQYSVNEEYLWRHVKPKPASSK